MAIKTKSRCIARTAVLIDGKRHEISAYRLGKGFAAKWQCATCGREGAIPKAPRHSILEAFIEARTRVYKHYERVHEQQPRRA